MIRLKRLSGWRIATVVFGVLALVGAGLVIEIRSSADRAWKTMENRTINLIAEARTRPAGRSVLHGTPEPGSAWIEYENALDLLGTDRVGHDDTYKFLMGKADANRPAVEARIRKHAAAFAALRRGVRRAEGAYPYDWDDTEPHKNLRLLRLMELGMLAAANARLQREAGNGRESAEILLDLLQFGGDVRRNSLLISDMIGLSIQSSAFQEFPSLLKDSSLGPQDWESIGRALEILDREWPPFSASLRNESLLVQATWLKAPSEGEFLETWRYGFSRRLMTASAGALIHRQLELLIDLESRPWPERLAREGAMVREIESSPNPLYQSGTLLSSCSSVRLRRTQLRLVRLAVEHRISGSASELGDPFGTQLRHTTSDSTIRFWSVGRDGRDHGGKGEWMVDRGDADLVLEIPR